MKNSFLLLVTLSLSGFLSAQDLRQYDYLYGSVLKPAAMQSDTLNHASLRNMYPFTRPSGLVEPRGKWYNKLYNKVFHENLISIEKPGFHFTADPLFDASLGREIVNESHTWLNTRGFQVYGQINSLKENHHPAEKSSPANASTKLPAFEFYTSYYESQVMFPGYLDSISRKVSGVPGQGSFRRANGTWDHGYATGWLRLRPNRYFTLEAGTGKNFFGNGYRSLLLSDNARNYPYFRIDTRIWRIHYTNLWAEFQDNKYKDGPQGAFQKKYGAFHYLSYSVTNRLELSFFEAVIWQGRDSLHTRGFDINYLNPVIFYRPVEWTMGSPDNAMMGVNLSYHFLDQTYVYGQFIIDEFGVDHMKARDGWYANKYAGQIGAKSFINFKNQPVTTPLQNSQGQSTAPEGVTARSFRGVFLQTELNFARPYTYSHWNNKQNYSHLSQPLAHPLGANFVEWVSFARLHFDRWMLEGRYSLARFGTNYNGLNYGQDIFLPYTSYVTELGNYIGQGLANNLSYKTLTCSYLLNPASLLNIFVSVTDRRQTTETTDNHALWFSFGVRNSIRNFYYDY